MDLKDKTVIVTGGGRGIGKALCLAFVARGANVVVADVLGDEARAAAEEIDGLGVVCDVTRESDIQQLVKQAEEHFGPIDVFCSNAGVCFGEPDTAASASDETWNTCWNVHVMAHVYAARAVLPGMIKRRQGYLVQMASAAGLLNQIGDAAYSTTKHAAVGFAESLAISHGDDGIKVSVVCPQYVATPMLGYNAQEDISQYPGIITPKKLADATMEGIEEEKFLILPHPQVEQFMQFKTSDHDRWVGGMRKLRRTIIEKNGNTKIQEMHKLI